MVSLDGSRFHLQQSGIRCHCHDLVLFSQLQGERLPQVITGVHRYAGLHRLFEPRSIHCQLVLSDGKLCEQEFSGRIGHGCIFQLRAGLDGHNRGVGNNGAGRVLDPARDLPCVHLSKRGRRIQEQKSGQKNGRTDAVW